MGAMHRDQCSRETDRLSELHFSMTLLSEHTAFLYSSSMQRQKHMNPIQSWLSSKSAESL